MTTARQEVFNALNGEREYQERKWGPGRDHEIASFILYMEHHLAKARHLASTSNDERPALHELRKVAALYVRCAEQHGAPTRQDETHEANRAAGTR